MTGPRGVRAAILALVAVAASAPGPARAGDDSPADSTAAFAWGGHYRTELYVLRDAREFPWNDEAQSSSARDRLALFADLRAGFGVSLFAKGATGLHIQGSSHDNRFTLEQAHALWSGPGGGATARLFARERVYSSNHRLMKIVSDDSPFLAGRGEGWRLDLRAGGWGYASWIESALRDSAATASAGGLPSAQGGSEAFRSIRLEAKPLRRVRVGAVFQQVRSLVAGDAVVAGADAAFEAGGASLIVELARSSAGTVEDLAEGSLFEADGDALDSGRPSDVFSENDAFAASIEGLRVDVGGFGSAGLVPTYNFSGSSFIDVQGEIAPGVVETKVLLWYRPPTLDVLASVTAADTASRGTGGWYVAGRARGRLRGGFEAEQGIAVREDGRWSASLSLASDAARSRTHLAVLVDDAGKGNDLSCFAASRLNLGSRLTAGCALHLVRPGLVRYALSCGIRSRGRFLFTVEAGSFLPAFEEIALTAGGPPVDSGEERAVSVSGRIGFGGM